MIQIRLRRRHEVIVCCWKQKLLNDGASGGQRGELEGTPQTLLLVTSTEWPTDDEGELGR